MTGLATYEVIRRKGDGCFLSHVLQMKVSAWYDMHWLQFRIVFLARHALCEAGSRGGQAL